MTKDEALKLALSTLDEVRQETFRLSRDGQKLYAEENVWSTIISIKEVLAQEQEPVAWISHDFFQRHILMTFAEKAIDVAIKLEREACAKEAERTFYSVQAAENIRARGKE